MDVGFRYPTIGFRTFCTETVSFGCANPASGEVEKPFATSFKKNPADNPEREKQSVSQERYYFFSR